LGEGDAAAIQAYFSKMQSFSPGFFFSFDLDDEGRLKNVFWADNRCRQAYKEFGDVVTFDTTYLTNKYDMSFAPFVGVNHHGHSTLLGCGLLSNEDTETFVWLFRIWLECMEFEAPQGIITDQDRAIQNAIEVASILSSVHKLVYESQSAYEFEQSWFSMLDMYELKNNEWLIGLFRERIRWVPCFLKTSFWAGMSTTQRSEGMNAFFDGYVHSKTSLKQFVEQYERAMRSKIEKEFQADFKTFSQMVPCVTRFDLERQFQSAFTIVKFKEFQQELTGNMYCEIESSDEGSFSTRYVVTEDFTVHERVKEKKFEIIFEIDKCTFSCSCHLFEFRGIICRHAIVVLIRNKLSAVPEQYILRRWRKDVSRLYMRVKSNYNGWITTPGQLNYEKLCKAFTDVADLATYNDDETQKLLEWIETKASDLAISKLGSGCGRNLISELSMQVDHVDDATQVSTCKVLDPKYTKTKGAPKNLRKKGRLEKSSKKSKVSMISSKEKNSQPKKIQSSNVFIQPPDQNTVMTPLSFSQQLMGVHHHPWNIDYGVHLVSNYGGDQASTTRWSSNDDEVIGSMGVINYEAS
ncbi:protein FAR1-RELATED SEQUENCE 5-like, partial [Primulina eburnea]|uniref:protein FAR1-RELATED SEQUENCE 5-like n=1 Tax=Primulina eburnea TaxID=1245227 RepID=UPI003C6BD775